MSDRELREIIKTTIVDVLNLEDDTTITDETSAKDVTGWDSLQHVRIMLALERKFNFRWEEQEISDVKNVGDLLKNIARKLAKTP